MLPDPNDRPTPSRPRRGMPRGLTVAVAVTALAVFAGLIGYSYMTGSRRDGPVPVIHADQRPIKMRPENPGGMDVPHQDKEIYNRMAGEPSQPKVERLLPPPETPLPRPANAPPPLETEVPPAPVVAPPPDAVEVPQAPATPPRQPGPAASAPQPAPATPAPTQQAAPSPSRPASPPAVAAAPAAPAAAAAGKYRIQLAALRSADDANREWEKLRRAHPDLLGRLSLNVTRADLGSRGTFYRIQAGPLASEDAARDLCRKLSEKKVGCIVVRP